MCTVATEFDTDKSETGRRRGPSGVLLLTGILAILVSGWALIGAPAFDGIDAGAGWILVLIAVIVGAILVFTPSRKR